LSAAKWTIVPAMFASATSARPRRHRDARDLLCLDARGHDGVAQQRLRDAQPRDHAPQPLAQQLAADAEYDEAGEQPRDREPAALRGRAARVWRSRAREPEQGHAEPQDQHGAVHA
jgi:hypothetical protein